MRGVVFGLLVACAAAAPSVGDKLPSVEVHDGFPPAGGSIVDIAKLVAGKKVILVGLPGAFTPT